MFFGMTDKMLASNKAEPLPNSRVSKRLMHNVFDALQL
jgi:hypothetical protein